MLSTAADLSSLIYESFALRIVARDHGQPPRSSHVDLVVIVDSSIPYTNRHDQRHPGGEDIRERIDELWNIDANLPFILTVLGFCAAFVVIVIVLIAVAAVACPSRRASRAARQVIKGPHSQNF